MTRNAPDTPCSPPRWRPWPRWWRRRRTAAPSFAATGCQQAPQGLVENSWLGGSGSWSDAAHWSQQVVPGLATRDYACLPTGSDVVVDASIARVDLDLLDVGAGARLTLQPGTALYVWGDQQELRSVVRGDAVLEVDGATLGGGGRLQVIGTVDVHRSTDARRRPSAPTGVLTEQGRQGSPGDRRPGSARRTRRRRRRLARKHAVDVRGLARLRDNAGRWPTTAPRCRRRSTPTAPTSGRLPHSTPRVREGRRSGIN